MDVNCTGMRIIKFRQFSQMVVAWVDFPLTYLLMNKKVVRGTLMDICELTKFLLQKLLPLLNCSRATETDRSWSGP